MIATFMMVWRSLVRGHFLTAMLAAVAAAHFFLPSLVRSDGTAAGTMEMFVRAVPGAATVFLSIALLCCACGMFAKAREGSRLALAVVRPVSAFSIASGAWLALCAAGAIAFAFNAIVVAVRIHDAPRCAHRFMPALPPVEVAARAMLAEYLADPKTPERVRNAPRSAVLALLANKELDRYDVVKPGEKFSWPFDVETLSGGTPSVRVRFATVFEMRAPLVGNMSMCGREAAVSNCTQSVIEVPLVESRTGGDVAPGPDGKPELVFDNKGTEPVLLRPRRDLEVRIPADSFAANLARATIASIATAALLAAFGIFLSSVLSRPVAVFTGIVAVLLVVLSPGVVAQFPDSLDVPWTDRLGLVFSRAVCRIAYLVTEASPVSDLATGVCVEWKQLIRTVAVDCAILPAAMLGLSALALRRKPLSDNSQGETR